MCTFIRGQTPSYLDRVFEWFAPVLGIHALVIDERGTVKAKELDMKAPTSLTMVQPPAAVYVGAQHQALMKLQQPS